MTSSKGDALALDESESIVVVKDREALEELRAIGEQIAVSVVRELPGWAQREVERILDAWNRLEDGARADAVDRAYRSGERAADRIGRELRELINQDPGDQSGTPLQIVREAYREPTAVLRELGIAEIVRDPFEERAFPHDGYGLAPKALNDLGDPDAGPLMLAWGLAKARVLRIRADSARER